MARDNPRSEVDKRNPFLITRGLLIVLLKERPNEVECSRLAAAPFPVQANHIAVRRAKAQDHFDKLLAERLISEAVIPPRIFLRQITT